MIRFPPGRSFLSLVAVLLALAVSGCSIALFPEKQALRIFTLPYDYSPATTGNQNLGELPALKVVRPHANGVLAGERILIEEQPNELAAYSSVRWVADAPVLLRDHLVRALREAPGLSAVVSDTSGSSSKVTLSSNLLAFQEVHTEDNPQARIYLQAQLVENGSRKMLASKDFDISVSVGDSQIEAVVAAFGEASDQLSTELAEWIRAELADY